MFYEVNGASNEQPIAQRFDRDLSPQDDVQLAPLEYRMTDATTVDSNGRFWTTNYFYEGDTWATAACPLSQQFGVGESHVGELTVERLVELELGDDGVRVSRSAPILLELAAGVGRNWEGVARLDDRGFVLATDEHPCTMLAFVPTT